MSLSDPLGDMLTRIRNGQKAGKATIVSPASKVRASVLDVLKREGYIRGYQQSDGDSEHRKAADEARHDVLLMRPLLVRAGL